MSQEVKVTSSDSQMVIEGVNFKQNGAKDWAAFPLNDSKVLLSYEGDSPSVAYKNGFAWLPVEILASILTGYVAQKWTGMITVETNLGTKQVYLVKGQIVFARSELVDDRLGEVIYREGDLSVDDLMTTTAQVSRERKFGQVLVLTGLFDNLRLWHALKAQVVQILRSIFMESYVSVAFLPGESTFSEVYFEEGSLKFVEKCISFGSMYRGFENRVSPSCVIKLLDEQASFSIYPEGTFLGDLLRIIKVSKDLSELLNCSKVQEKYTISSLMLLVNQGFCEVENMKPYKIKGGIHHILPLKSNMNIYEFLIKEQRHLFEREGLEYPVQEIKSMTAQLNEGDFPVIFLDDFGLLHSESVNHIYNQCITTPARTQFFESAIDTLMRFSMQIAADRLSKEGVDKIKGIYEEFIHR